MPSRPGYTTVETLEAVLIWLGGLAGGVYITVALISVPRPGALSFIMAVVPGQLIISLVIDYFGLPGLPKNIPGLTK